MDMDMDMDMDMFPGGAPTAPPPEWTAGGRAGRRNGRF